jgi:hypothetical protein
VKSTFGATVYFALPHPVIKQIAYAWHPNVSIRVATVKTQKKNVMSDKNITHFHSKRSGFGDFEQKQNTTALFTFFEPCIVIHTCNKNQQNEHLFSLMI